MKSGSLLNAKIIRKSGIGFQLEILSKALGLLEVRPGAKSIQLDQNLIAAIKIWIKDFKELLSDPTDEKNHTKVNVLRVKLAILRWRFSYAKKLFDDPKLLQKLLHKKMAAQQVIDSLDSVMKHSFHPSLKVAAEDKVRMDKTISLPLLPKFFHASAVINHFKPDSVEVKKSASPRKEYIIIGPEKKLQPGDLFLGNFDFYIAFLSQPYSTFEPIANKLPYGHFRMREFSSAIIDAIRNDFLLQPHENPTPYMQEICRSFLPLAEEYKIRELKENFKSYPALSRVLINFNNRMQELIGKWREDIFSQTNRIMNDVQNYQDFYTFLLTKPGFRLSFPIKQESEIEEESETGEKSLMMDDEKSNEALLQMINQLAKGEISLMDGTRPLIHYNYPLMKIFHSLLVDPNIQKHRLEWDAKKKENRARNLNDFFIMVAVVSFVAAFIVATSGFGLLTIPFLIPAAVSILSFFGVLIGSSDSSEEKKSPLEEAKPKPSEDPQPPIDNSDKVMNEFMPKSSNKNVYQVMDEKHCRYPSPTQQKPKFDPNVYSSSDLRLDL